jgi:hypothetical protein
MGGVRALIGGTESSSSSAEPAGADAPEFDTIYHEHLSYFSLATACRLAERHGLAVFDVEPLGVHGGSLRVFVGAPDRARRAGVEMLSRERAAGSTARDLSPFRHAGRDHQRRVPRARDEIAGGRPAPLWGATKATRSSVRRASGRT